MDNLLVTFSGGKTSAYMTKMLIEQGKYNIKVVFANTGQENNETLNFINECDSRFDFNTVWVEADVQHGEKVGTKHKIVNYKTANRDGGIFEEVIKKYGIPNKSYPHCNRELKLAPIHNIAKELFNGEKYKTAIGIRIDEKRRVSKAAEKAHSDGIIYPLIDIFPTDKIDITDFWEDQDFTLNLKEHQGNCKWCWKKSLKKHFAIIKENPEFFNFPEKMEELYPHAGHNDGIRKRVFFRGNRSTNDLFALAVEVDIENSRQLNMFEDGGCSESCEPFEMIND